MTNLEKKEQNWEKEFDNEFVDRISGDMWQTTSREQIKSFIRQNFVSKKIIEETIEKITNWSEAQPGAGQEIGALFGAGMYQQYDADKTKHEQQIADLRKELLEDNTKL